MRKLCEMPPLASLANIRFNSGAIGQHFKGGGGEEPRSGLSCRYRRAWLRKTLRACRTPDQTRWTGIASSSARLCW